MRTIILIAMFFSMSANAADFAAREKVGKEALATAEGQKYEAQWGEVIGTVMRACIPPGTTSPANLGKFTFVANVDNVGNISSVEVNPSTNISRCFAQQFASSHLPPPPSSPRLNGFYPVADVMSVTP